MKKYLMSNLDYQRLRERIGQAKHDTNTSRGQLLNLAKRLQEATLFESTKLPANVVTMNSQVTVTYVNSPKTLTIQLVYPEQADAQQKRISILAPIATALLGCRERELVELPTPYGTVKVRIDCVLYQPEAAGDFAL